MHLKNKLGRLFAVATICIVSNQCSPDKAVVKKVEASSHASGDVVAHNSQSVLDALKLTSDPALPSDLLQDDAYREELRAHFVSEVEQLSCKSLRVSLRSKSDDGAETLLLEARSNGFPYPVYGLLDVPHTSGALQPLIVYANSAKQSFVDTSEVNLLFRGVSAPKVTVIYPNQNFEFLGTQYGNGAATVEPWSTEVDALYLMSLCLQQQVGNLTLESGKTFDDFLIPSGTGYKGHKTVLAGSGVGALIANLAAARSGALLLTPDANPNHFVHYDCSVSVNPVHSLYAAEWRLILSALIKGRTEETRYPEIPGINEIRYALFKPFRDGHYTTDTLAFEIAKRDALITAPFVNMAIKNYSLPLTNKGLEPGSMFVAHFDNANAFPVNGSRIFANVFGSVNFKLSEVSHGVQFLYREYPDTGHTTANFADAFTIENLERVGEPISPLFIRTSEFLTGKEQEYTNLLQGNSLQFDTQGTFTNTLSSFLTNQCY